MNPGDERREASGKNQRSKDGKQQDRTQVLTD